MKQLYKNQETIEKAQAKYGNQITEALVQEHKNVINLYEENKSRYEGRTGVATLEGFEKYCMEKSYKVLTEFLEKA